MATYTFHKYTEQTAAVVPVLANTANIAQHTVVTINAGEVTVKNTAAAAGDFLVWRPYPSYNIVGDRYGKIASTPISTSTGALYGFFLKAGDELIVVDNASINGLNNGSLLKL